MSKVTKIGKIKSYDPQTGKVVCHGDPKVFFWKGGVVRIAGSRPSVCHTTTKLFDVTVSASTAALLLPEFQLNIEYDDRTGAEERVTTFAGESIASTTLLPSIPPPAPV